MRNQSNYYYNELEVGPQSQIDLEYDDKPVLITGFTGVYISFACFCSNTYIVDTC